MSARRGKGWGGVVLWTCRQKRRGFTEVSAHGERWRREEWERTVLRQGEYGHLMRCQSGLRLYKWTYFDDRQWNNHRVPQASPNTTDIKQNGQYNATRKTEIGVDACRCRRIEGNMWFWVDARNKIPRAAAVRFWRVKRIRTQNWMVILLNANKSVTISKCSKKVASKWLADFGPAAVSCATSSKMSKTWVRRGWYFLDIIIYESNQ